jgi:FkbM family methyltransferase
VTEDAQAPPDVPDDADDPLAKTPARRPRRDRDEAALARRAKRNQRKAWAEGYLTGICSLLRKGDLAVDLGANRGDITAKLAATGADVVAFEPDPFSFGRLRERFADVANVTLINAAAGVGQGTVRLMRADNFDTNPEGASVKSTILDGGRRIDAGHGIDVPLIDFPTWVRQQVARHGQIAFIKMDIEGAELDILEAMLRDRLFADVRSLVAETHERKFKDLRDRYKALRAGVAKQEPSGKINLDWI